MNDLSFTYVRTILSEKRNRYTKIIFKMRLFWKSEVILQSRGYFGVGQKISEIARSPKKLIKHFALKLSTKYYSWVITTPTQFFIRKRTCNYSLLQACSTQSLTIYSLWYFFHFFSRGPQWKTSDLFTLTNCAVNSRKVAQSYVKRIMGRYDCKI